MLAIPGVGSVVAAGWLVATAVGAVAGAAGCHGRFDRFADLCRRSHFRMKLKDFVEVLIAAAQR
jgi:hypothetical protein